VDGVGVIVVVGVVDVVGVCDGDDVGVGHMNVVDNAGDGVDIVDVVTVVCVVVGVDDVVVVAHDVVGQVIADVGCVGVAFVDIDS